MKKVLLTAGILALGLAQAQHSSWGYQGAGSPEHWGELEGAGKCGQSKSQSPINIITKKVKTEGNAKDLTFHYALGDVKDIVDTGHSLQFDFKEGSYITYKGQKYNLYQFHAHEESEHTIDGVRYPLELHFVHISEDKSSVIVIGVMVKDGDQNSYFEKLNVFKELAKDGKKDTDIEFNPEKMYPKNKNFYTYHGSLTTPPCSDNVTWIVFKEPITMSEDEIDEIEDHLPKANNRPVQPINGRTVMGTK